MIGNRKTWAISLLLLASAGLAAFLLGLFGPWEGDLANSLLFAAAVLAFTLLAVSLLGLAPALQRGSALGRLRSLLLIIAVVAGALGANLAFYRNDVHFDVTREANFTPPPEALELVAGLDRPLTLSYFYNKGDGDALRAVELLEILGRSSPYFTLRTVDIDKEPELTRAYEVPAYNTVVVEAEGRRIMQPRTTDLTQMAYLALRALRGQVETLCYASGHGELVLAPAAGHLHYTHRETLRAEHGYGTEDELVAEPDGGERLAAALDSVGFSTEALPLEQIQRVPDSCTIVAVAGPRRPMSDHAAEVLQDYLAGGGALLLLIDPETPAGQGLGTLLAGLGLGVEPGTVIDPTNHFGADLEAVAVPSYARHPVTEGLGLTYFGGARSLTFGLPPESVTIFPLFGSSRDSYLQYADQEEDEAEASPRAQRMLGLAAEGRLPDSPPEARPFRMVAIGDSDFLTNAGINTVSNGDLALSAVRWLARDESLPQIRRRGPGTDRVVLTSSAMQTIFLSVGVALPLLVVLAGALVWWRRR